MKIVVLVLVVVVVVAVAVIVVVAKKLHERMELKLMDNYKLDRFTVMSRILCFIRKHSTRTRIHLL